MGVCCLRRKKYSYWCQAKDEALVGEREQQVGAIREMSAAGQRAGHGRCVGWNHGMDVLISMGRPVRYSLHRTLPLVQSQHCLDTCDRGSMVACRRRMTCRWHGGGGAVAPHAADWPLPPPIHPSRWHIALTKHAGDVVVFVGSWIFAALKIQSPAFHPPSSSPSATRFHQSFTFPPSLHPSLLSAAPRTGAQALPRHLPLCESRCCC